jgi:hypothetical protein
MELANGDGYVDRQQIQIVENLTTTIKIHETKYWRIFTKAPFTMHLSSETF